MNRKEQRKLIVDADFAHFFQKESFLADVRDSILTNFWPDQELEKIHDDYLSVITNAITENEAKYRDLITKHLKKTWRLDRIPKLDLAILEVAVAEMHKKSDIPFDVTVNEAVEFAKNYSTKQSPAFVNGILVKIFEDIETEGF